VKGQRWKALKRAFKRTALALVKNGSKRSQSVAMNFKIDCSKKGRPNKRWKEAIDVDMKVRKLKRSDAVDRTLWRLGCRTGLPLHAGTTNRAPGK